MNEKPIVFMFSGQGSQYYQMGKELYEHHPNFKLWMDRCDLALRPLINKSLVELLYGHSKAETFDRILYTNPALLSIEYSLARMLMGNGVRPDYLLGYSLGEVTASIVSGALSFERGLELVVETAHLLESRSPAAGMLAIIGPESLLTEMPDAFYGCTVSGRNFRNNFVVSGLAADIERLQLALKAREVLCQRLPVKYGFHSKLMDPLENTFKAYASELEFLSPQIPSISSLTSEPIVRFSGDYLWNVVREPVQFSVTIEKLLKQDDYVFVDVGPSGTLANSVKYILDGRTGSIAFEVMNQFGKDLRCLDRLLSGIPPRDVMHA